MGEWKECKLGDVLEDGSCVIKNNLREPLSKMQRSQRKNGALYPYYGAASAIDYINDFKFDGFHLLIAEDGTVTSNGVAPMLQLVDGKFWVSNHAHILQCKSKWQTIFLYFLLLNVDINPFITGAVQPKLNKANLLKIPLFLPEDKNEQEAIASVLSSLDDKIDLLHRQNKTLESVAETLFRQWFVEEAKEDWEEGCLGDVIELMYGKGLKQEIRTGSGFPVVGSSGIVGYHSESLVEGPGIVIGRKGTLGKVIYLFENFFPIDTTYYVKSKVESVGLLYEYFLLKTLNFEDMNSDSAVPGLNRDLALSTEIKIPPLEILQDFNDFTSVFVNKLNTNQTQIRTLEKLRDTLLPKLMSGEVRIGAAYV